MKFVNNGKMTVCGQWTSEMKTHFEVSVAHCSDNEEFNKKIGKKLALTRMNYGMCVVLRAKNDCFGFTVGLKEQLKDFIYVNC